MPQVAASDLGLYCLLMSYIKTLGLYWLTGPQRLIKFEIEVEACVAYARAYVIGYVDKTDLKKNQTYSHCYRTFRRYHGMSAIANITTLACNTMYLYYLTCQLCNT